MIYSITSKASANRLVTLTDTGSGTPVFSTLATAATNTIFRGVDFAPVPEPGSAMLLLVVTALTAVCSRFRRVA